MLLTSKNVINMTLTFDFDCLAFFGLGDVGLFYCELWHLISGSYSKFHVSWLVMTLLSKSGSFWRCSMMFWHICMWRSFWSSFSSLGSIFVQTFRISKSSVIIFQTLSFSCPADLRSFKQSTGDRRANLLYPLDVHLILVRSRPPTPRIIFHHLSPLFEPHVPLKNTCSWHFVISIHLLKHFKCLWQSFSRAD